MSDIWDKTGAVPATIVLERVYDAPPPRIFRAFSDPAAFAQWHMPGGDWVNAESHLDFRVGGRQMVFFGPPGAPRIRGESRFEDIVENARIITAGSMIDEAANTRFTSTLCTVEFFAEGEGTRLVLTDQSVFYGFETPGDRRKGWGEVLDKLAAHLEGGSP